MWWLVRTFLLLSIVIFHGDRLSTIPLRTPFFVQASTEILGELQGDCPATGRTCGDESEVAEPSLIYSENTGGECVDVMDNCELLISQYSSRGEACISLFQIMQHGCRRSCLLCGSNTANRARNIYSDIDQEIMSAKGWEYLFKVDEYMYKKVFVDDWYASVRNHCKNKDELCTFWASTGECSHNPTFMNELCAPACFSCQHVHEECQDKNHQCQILESRFSSKAEFCISMFETVWHDCRKTCLLCGNHIHGLVRSIYHENDQEINTREAWDFVVRTDKYMYNQVYLDSSLDGVKRQCKNRNPLCIFWASVGECEKNSKYMKRECAPACLSCDQLSIETRCPYDPTEPKAWSKPGDLNKMFTRIITEPEFQQYNPQILSHPEPSSKDNDVVMMRGPWVVLLENFLSPEEAETLIELGRVEGYNRSLDVSAVRRFDGTLTGVQSFGRTSSNAWCFDKCGQDPVTQAVHQRMEHLIEIPMENFEHIQLLRYEETQYYMTHHDYVPTFRSSGPRILTVFLYLNDVEEGGGTNFPLLNDMTILPKRGRALLWPSVLDEDPMERDPRTEHQALPVNKGVKYAANVWVHQREFREAFSQGCH